MFGKKNEVISVSSDKVDTIIGKNTVLTGTIKAVGIFRVDGSIEGDIESKGDVVIGESGKVTGNVIAKQIVIAGEIRGNVKADDILEILSEGKLFGDISVGKLIINDGANFEGKCQMTKIKNEDRNGSKGVAKQNSESM